MNDCRLVRGPFGYEAATGEAPRKGDNSNAKSAGFGSSELLREMCVATVAENAIEDASGGAS